MRNDLASLSSLLQVQDPTDDSDAIKTSYEARGDGGSNPSRRTKQTLNDTGPNIDWAAIARITIYRSPDFYLTKEEVLSMFPTAQFPLPKSVYISICEHAKQTKNGLRTKTRRTQKRTIYKNLQLHKLWIANGKKCYLCGDNVPYSTVTRDHVFPKSEGYDLANNTMPACSRCNSSKGHKYPSLQQVRQAVLTYKRMGGSFRPSRGKRDSAINLLAQLGVFS